MALEELVHLALALTRSGAEPSGLLFLLLDVFEFFLEVCGVGVDPLEGGEVVVEDTDDLGELG